jgi:hypothetical protein
MDTALLAWATHTRGVARSEMQNPAHAHWYRHQRTWFVGVDALPNDDIGTLPGGLPLSGHAVDFVRDHLGFTGPMHRAQLSVCFPGYPKRDPDETDAQHRFRIVRDAAHLDGLLGEGPGNRRHMREFHRFILGIPLNDSSADAAPFVIWEGSQHIMRKMLDVAFAGVAPANWGEIDLTEVYKAARKRVFEACARVVIHARPGEAYLAHRFSVHGVAPWAEGAAPPAGRMIAYFRPETNDRVNWLTAD